jgi:hypothetical protein
MIALAMLFCRGAVRLCRVVMMFGSLIMSILCHGVLVMMLTDEHPQNAKRAGHSKGPFRKYKQRGGRHAILAGSIALTVHRIPDRGGTRFHASL